MFKKVLIANRGEIACRIIKTLHRMGIESIAIYSWADRFSPHVKMATEAFCIGEPTPAKSYLNIEKIIAIALEANADAIHPGYGFLSENPDFAEACQQNGIVFIGPNSQAMRDVGSKQRAKQMLEGSSVPLIPGFNPEHPSDDELEAAAHAMGWPVVLKAAHGGGGKGLKIVKQASEFKHAIASARREAKSYFNNDELLLEKFIEHPRHLEVQILADQHGHVVHLFERDCSVQRRQQKIIEEAPAIHLSPQLRQKLYDCAIQVAKTFSYTNAGTVEFLLAEHETLYFMEMNARLQVEHPITEMITGLDLVEWQIRIANGERIGFNQPEKPVGHAIECRICAEQPQHDFRPSQGQIQQLSWPKTSANCRIDTGIENQQQIESHYDSLLAKMICWEDSRDKAIQSMQTMLNDTQILGIETNVEYLNHLLSHPVWLKGAVGIDFLAKHHTASPPMPIEQLQVSLACMDSIHFWRHQNHLPSELSGLSITQTRYSPRQFVVNDEEITLFLNYVKPGIVKIKDTHQTIHYQYQQAHLFIDDGKAQFSYRIEFHPDVWLIHQPQQVTKVQVAIAEHSHQKGKAQDGNIVSPMPATIVAILKNNGDSIEQGEPLLVLEAMKMEHTIYAPFNGTIKQLFHQLGQQVQEGQQLLELIER
jgi:3-methylcrotonyl-CoA carboxylase alpha subunit